ncbi:hypothetical protein Taro_040579 [Colocasia esculenta]|uniref:CASP-like protein n=1 Tax=Colocasia esculenta TaxID=4460 RepID=A0A843WYQ3_COLES|nr:hypothetical protein [Colocasia esculenta]
MDAAANGMGAPPTEVRVKMPEAEKVAAVDAPGLVARTGADAVRLALRMASLATSAVSLSLMLSSEQSGTLSLYGFQLPVSSKWSFSEAFEFLVGVSVAVAAHSMLQLLVAAARMVRRSPVIASQSHAWIIFACDQAFAYAMMSAGSAAAGVTNLNRTGIRHSALPDFCKPLHRFCDRVAVSIAFAFLSWVLLAASAVFDVFWLWSY